MGFRLETPGRTPQIYTNGHTRLNDDPYKILYHRQNKRDREEADRERGMNSEYYIETLFQQHDRDMTPYFPWLELEKTQKNGPLDRAGADYLFHLREHNNINFAELTGIKTLRVDVKSSETGVEDHMKHGMKKGNEWWKNCMMVLDAGWDNKMIYADFVAQLTNLVGIQDNQEEIDDFLRLIHPEIAQYYVQAMAGDYMQYRGELLDWVYSGLDA